MNKPFDLNLDDRVIELAGTTVKFEGSHPFKPFKKAEIWYEPADRGSGYTIITGEGTEQTEIPVTIENVSHVKGLLWSHLRAESNGAHADIIEHALSPLYGLGIDDARVYMPQGVFPNLRGFMSPILFALTGPGATIPGAHRADFVDFMRSEKWSFGDAKSGIEIIPFDDPTLPVEIEYHVSYPGGVGEQQVTYKMTRDEYLEGATKTRGIFLIPQKLWKVENAIPNIAKHVGMDETNTHFVGERLGTPGNPYWNPENAQEVAMHKAHYDVTGELAACLPQRLIGVKVIYKRVGHRDVLDALRKALDTRVLEPMYR